VARAARARGARTQRQVRAKRLIVSGERVAGVTGSGPDGPVVLRAAAVVLTTGGFSRSDDLMARFAPAMEHTVRGGAEGSTGDGLRMAAKAGAGLADMPYVKGTFGIFPWPSAAEEGTGILAVYRGAIAVNGHGDRFTDESAPYKEIGDACMAQPEGRAYQMATL
jgi:fumarate reductase flavoprotein subunit